MKCLTKIPISNFVHSNSRSSFDLFLNIRRIIAIGSIIFKANSLSALEFVWWNWPNWPEIMFSIQCFLKRFASYKPTEANRMYSTDGAGINRPFVSWFENILFRSTRSIVLGPLIIQFVYSNINKSFFMSSDTWHIGIMACLSLPSTPRDDVLKSKNLLHSDLDCGWPAVAWSIPTMVLPIVLA